MTDEKIIELIQEAEEASGEKLTEQDIEFILDECIKLDE